MAFASLPLRLLLPFAAILYVVPFASAQQQEIECLIPHKMGDGPRPVYDTGESVQFQWKATYPTFNLTIVQTDHKTQQKTRQQTFSNEPNTTSNFIWTAENFAGLSQDDPMHLWITNSKDFECPTCSCRSANFTVLDATSTNTSTTPTSTPTGSSTSSASANASRSGNHLELGLGLGLGLGIPLLIITTALATWLLVRRRRQQRQGNITARTYNGSLDPTPSTTIPLSSAPPYTQPSSLGYSSDPSEKAPTSEMDSHEIAEMQTDEARVEAPQNAVRAELAGDDATARAMYDVKKL